MAKPTKALQESLKKDGILITLGAFDALSARIIEQAGIQAIITAGFGISASHLGQPDAELYTMTENLNIVKNMALAVQIPIIADLDTGYGNALNVIRAVREFERAGAAGGIIEDQVFPKRCPACVDSVDLIPLGEALGKIRAALDAREDPDFLIIGRTDAQGEEAVRRANAYLEAGAQMVMLISKAFRSFSELEKLGPQIQGPFCLNYFEDLAYPSWLQSEWKMEKLRGTGVKILNFPWVLLLAAAQAMREIATHVSRHHTVKDLRVPMRMKHEEFLEMIGFPKLRALQIKYLRPSGLVEKN